MKLIYRLGQPHNAIKGRRVVREIDAFRCGNTKRMSLEGKAGHTDVIRYDAALDFASAVSDLERLLGVLERVRGGRTEKVVVSLTRLYKYTRLMN